MMEDDAGIRDAADRDAASQLQWAHEHTHEPKNAPGITTGGTNPRSSGQNPDGRSAHAWGRAVGWYMLGWRMRALCRGKSRMLRSVAGADEKSARGCWKSADGAWAVVLDCPGREGNYLESSGSCPMTAAILKAAANHQLPDWMLAAAQESFRRSARHFVWQMRDGTLFLAKRATARAKWKTRVPRRVV